MARGMVSRIRYETVRRVLKKRTDALASGVAVLSAGAGGGLWDPEGKGAEPYSMQYGARPVQTVADHPRYR